MNGFLKHRRCVGILVFLLTLCSVATSGQSHDLELSRDARPWEFFCAVGTRAGLFGNESGNFEAWVYPLKIFRNFHLRFLTDGRSIPAETLVRTVTVRPESSAILYAGDTFSVKETLLVPVRESGAVIVLEVETVHPLEIEAIFERDFQLEWPAALGGTYSDWDAGVHAFYFGEEQRKYAAFVGSPTAVFSAQEYQTNYSDSPASALRLGPTLKGKETKIIAVAASVSGRDDAEASYRRLSADYSAEAKDSAKYYRDFLARTVSVELPDAQLQQAYDWARISAMQGLVTNPYLGTGLIAGYRTSGRGQRPGFAWFFGRDSFWTALALDSEGDFATAKTALDFVSKYQRADGKIPHEISQGASFVNWFADYPYAYASADATPLYLIAAEDYVTQSGDTAFAVQKWDSLWKAYQFLRSTYDSQGLPQNFGFGHGWVEGGPLLPVKTEFYQSGLGAEALSALSRLAHFAGKDDISQQLAQEFIQKKQLVNQAFWSAESGTYVFALDNNNQKVVEPSVLATVPMWFGLLDPQKASSTITRLAAPDHQTDWGMRIISSRSSRYDPGGYHYGSVWPLFTGWASVGEYRYHRSLSAFANLRSNAMLAIDGSLGHVTEVLSGDYYQGLSTSSPHQVWSSAMVISPLLRGLLGIEVDAVSHRVYFIPHVPADWTSFEMRNVRVGDATLDFHFSKTRDEITLAIDSTGNCELDFSPGLSPRAQLLSTEVNGKRLSPDMQRSDYDQHPVVRAALAKGKNTVHIRLRNDFGISHPNSLPPLGSSSFGMRVISESWSASLDFLTIDLAGIPGARYDLAVWNAGQIASIEGAELHDATLFVQIPPSGSADYAHQKVTFHFRATERRP